MGQLSKTVRAGDVVEVICESGDLILRITKIRIVRTHKRPDNHVSAPGSVVCAVGTVVDDRLESGYPPGYPGEPYPVGTVLHFKETGLVAGDGEWYRRPSRLVKWTVTAPGCITVTKSGTVPDFVEDQRTQESVGNAVEFLGDVEYQF